MTHVELRALMDRTGVTRFDLVRLSGRTNRQATSWLNGTAPVPRSLAILLRAVDDRQVDLSWLLTAVMAEGWAYPPERRVPL